MRVECSALSVQGLVYGLGCEHYRSKCGRLLDLRLQTVKKVFRFPDFGFRVLRAHCAWGKGYGLGLEFSVKVR